MSLQDYFSCERGGVPPSGQECSKSEIQGRAFPTVVTVVFGLLLMFPVPNLFYLVSISKFGGLWQTLKTEKSGQPSFHSSSSGHEMTKLEEATSPPKNSSTTMDAENGSAL